MSNGGEIAEAQYVPTYYPGTRDERRATPIAVSAGQNLQGLDIDVSGSLVATRRLRGRVVHGLTGQPVPRGNLQIIPRDAPAILLIPGGTITNGTFDVGGALPGANYLVADGNGLSGLFAFDAGDSDLNDITVTLWPPVQISGQVRRSNATDSGDDLSLRGIAVTVRRSPAVNGLRDSAPAIRPIELQVGDTIFTAGDLSNLTAPDGTFTLLGLGPGDYAVDVRLPPDAYVESMQFGSRDVLRNGLRVDGPPPQARLDIVIGTRGGTMTGAVLDTRGAPAPDATVVALPDVRDRVDLFKTVTADESGRFEIRGLAPGDYEFLAVEQLEQGAWQSADEMREAEGRGRRVRITEGATIGGDLQLIPAAR
jgi:hypothetical protein